MRIRWKGLDVHIGLVSSFLPTLQTSYECIYANQTPINMMSGAPRRALCSQKGVRAPAFVGGKGEEGRNLRESGGKGCRRHMMVCMMNVDGKRYNTNTVPSFYPTLAILPSGPPSNASSIPRLMPVGPCACPGP